MSDPGERAGGPRGRILPLDPDSLFAALDQARIDYVLVGGFAVSAHGSVRATKDVDICPSPEEGNLRRLAELLRDLEAASMDLDELEDQHDVKPDLAGLRGGGNFRMRTRFGVLDVMQYLEPFQEGSWNRLRKNAEEVHLDGRRLLVCSYDDLLEMKQAAGRDQDLLDIRNLKASRSQL